MKLLPLFTTASQAVPVKTTNPDHPMFGKTVDLAYEYQYVEMHSAFCSVISIIEEESIHTIHLGYGHGICLTVMEQRADNPAKEVMRVPFSSSSTSTDPFISEIVTRIGLILVPQEIYEVNKVAIDQAIRKILPY
jgi:hypothetical protein